MPERPVAANPHDRTCSRARGDGGVPSVVRLRRRPGTMPGPRGLVTRLRLKQRARVPAGPPLARFQANRRLRASSLSDTPAASLSVTAAEKGPFAVLRSARLPATYNSYVSASTCRAPCNWTLLIDLSVIGLGGGGAVTGGRMAEREGTAAAAPERPRRGEACCLSPEGELHASSAGVDRLRSSAKLATDRRRPATARTVTRLQ